MSPRHQKNKRDIQDSTTEFFLKVVQKEKEQSAKENTNSKDNISITKTKTFDKFGRFYNYINQTMDKILSNKMSIMILSFAMAVLLFYSISGENILSSPTSGATIEDVPVIIENLNPDLELTGVPENVTVGLIGPSLDIYKTNFTKDYEVYLDLLDFEEGEYTVKLKSRNFPDTLTVMLVPDSLKIKLSVKKTEVYDLGYRFVNEDKLDSKYSVSVDEMSMNSVKIRAGEDTLQKIDKVEACIDVTDKTEAFEQDAHIKAFDSNGQELMVEISPKTVHVKCGIASYSKSVPIQANFVGEMPAGYQVSRYSLSQSKVTIYGLEENIKNISVIEVDVDVSNLKSDTTINDVPLKKVTGINKFSSDGVDVNVEIEKVITKRIDNISIKVLNNSEDYKVSFAGEGQYASVSVTGTEDKLSSLTADNIQASVDINGLGIGTTKVDVKAVADDDQIKVELLSSSQVTINIERK